MAVGHVLTCLTWSERVEIYGSGKHFVTQKVSDFHDGDLESCAGPAVGPRVVDASAGASCGVEDSLRGAEKTAAGASFH